LSAWTVAKIAENDVAMILFVISAGQHGRNQGVFDGVLGPLPLEKIFEIFSKL